MFGNIYEQIPKLLGTQMLSSDMLCEPTLSDGTPESFYIRSYYICEIQRINFFGIELYPKKVNDVFQHPTLLSIYTRQKEYRNYFFAPSEEDVLVPDVYYHKLTNWKDPLAESLQSMKLYSKDTFIQRGSISYSLKIETQTNYALSSKLSITGPSTNNHIIDGVLKTLMQIANDINNEKLKEYLNYSMLKRIYPEI